MTDSAFDIMAFDKHWTWKGKVDPSIRDNALWIRVEDAIAFIRDNKPEKEHWLIEVVG